MPIKLFSITLIIISCLLGGIYFAKNNSASAPICSHNEGSFNGEANQEFSGLTYIYLFEKLNVISQSKSITNTFFFHIDDKLHDEFLKPYDPHIYGDESVEQYLSVKIPVCVEGKFLDENTSEYGDDLINYKNIFQIISAEKAGEPIIEYFD